MHAYYQHCNYSNVIMVIIIIISRKHYFILWLLSIKKNINLINYCTKNKDEAGYTSINNYVFATNRHIIIILQSFIKMATTNHDIIIEEQPQLQYSTSCSEQQLDEGGEVIIIEGKCYKGGLMSTALKFHLWSHTSTLLNIICCIEAPVLLSIKIYNGYRAINIWRLYLTRTSIFYTKVNLLCACCGTTTTEIPLSLIEDIQVHTETHGGCCPGLKIAYTSTILMELKHTAESVPWYNKCCCTCIEPLIQIKCCENSMSLWKQWGERWTL